MSLLLVPALARAQGADPLEEAWHRYHQADFEGARALLRDVPGELPSAERAHWLELEAVVRFALREDGWRDVVADLAATAPDHRLADDAHPDLHMAFTVAKSYHRAPVEAALARARARFYVADFEGALEALDDIAPDEALTRAERVERTVLQALTLFALQRRTACRDRLEELAAIAPSYRFDQRVPPTLRRMWDRVRSPWAARRNG